MHNAVLLRHQLRLSALCLHGPQFEVTIQIGQGALHNIADPYCSTVAKVVGDDEVAIDIADGTRVRVVRSTITSVLARTEPVASKEAAKDDAADGDAKDKRKSAVSK